MAKIYSRLSTVYDAGWGSFARSYASLVLEILKERNLESADILDLACGTGILGIELATRGFRVHGIDASPEMIACAREKTTDLRGVTFEIADIISYRTNTRYDLAVCSFDSINYLLHDDDLMSVFSATAESLKPGGLFIFDSNTEANYRLHSLASYVREVNGVTLVQRCFYNESENVALTTIKFMDNVEENHVQRPYSLAELAPPLSKAGFSITHAWSGFDRKPFTDGCGRLFCLTTKKQPRIP